MYRTPRCAIVAVAVRPTFTAATSAHSLSPCPCVRRAALSKPAWKHRKRTCNHLRRAVTSMRRYK
ncbi:hypothetical protein PF005_g14132 [Phytophthora fragariae]|uniref:Uncharacterized protein n=1 Tax=Phytophthora fragariae TaxID=53985 RepID=A0A6A3KE98_9STRA|nr:hypothetical protein PF003_g4986 [Phytophthora fragariae]KAE8935374.1 hypothetical protein PF009_g14673 [Phytophthora fragariae]KAE9003025.1 hypothetical protein PF011_g13070 [Phytophthora fragariae]KAE9103262.1 hypothetical protein PF010_g13797 [Phytophthora fragariae]KAE9103451.1 hypothetical protein PF007_g14402 [Phytophthora fragariae]